MANEFYALLGRMRYITRWGLMRNSFSENIQEHSHQVAVLAHALALIRRDVLGLPSPDPDTCAVVGLYHDASETLTGDMPTPIKYYNKNIKEVFKSIEDEANHQLVSQLPYDLKAAYEDIFFKKDNLDYEWKLIKAADKLSALIKCIEEEKTGNREFIKAKEATEESLRQMSVNIPEITDFMKEFIPSYYKTLDELS